MKLSACNLGNEIDNLTDVASGKYSTVYASAEAAMINEFYTVKAWTSLDINISN